MPPPPPPPAPPPNRLRRTAASLLLVVATAALMALVGLSMALGAFLAGVLLAESEYRRELETDLEPFKGLLLGLFFIAVGMSIDFAVVLARPALVAGIEWHFQAHMLLGMTIFLLFPFSRLVHVWSGFGTVAYLFRPYQMVRSRRLNVPARQNLPRRAG